jgi:hypothetical protein
MKSPPSFSSVKMGTVSLSLSIHKCELHFHKMRECYERILRQLKSGPLLVITLPLLLGVAEQTAVD